MNVNVEDFINEQQKYSESYKQFLAFGGPCVYFHRECLRAGNESFLSKRHIELLYATLTAWGLHRMGVLYSYFLLVQLDRSVIFSYAPVFNQSVSELIRTGHP